MTPGFPKSSLAVSISGVAAQVGAMARWDKAPSSTIPDWFWQAVETPSEAGAVEVDECDVRYRTWRGAGETQLLLIHGMNAHSHWWDFIAPQLLDEYRVVAMDLTGMGDSDYRYGYNAETYAEEIVAVCDAADMGEKPLIVGHSFGGMMAAKAANLFPRRFGALVLVDSGIRHPDEPVKDQPMMGGGRPKTYPDRGTAESRFRLYPPQPCENRYIMEYIARQSLMRVEGGYAWKFDEELPLTLKGGERYPEDYTGLSMPVGLIYGKESASFSSRTLAYMLELLGADTPAVGIDDAQHHVFLDQPLAFVAALRDMLSGLAQRVGTG